MHIVRIREWSFSSLVSMNIESGGPDSPIQYHTWRKKMETNEKMRLLPQDKSHFDHSGDEKEKEKLFQSTIIHYNLLK